MPDESGEAALRDALRLIHNCLLVLPDGDFKRETEEWLAAALARLAPPLEHSRLDGHADNQSTVGDVRKEPKT